jgi:ABC-type multidrug transport system permease subunit
MLLKILISPQKFFRDLDNKPKIDYIKLFFLFLLAGFIYSMLHHIFLHEDALKETTYPTIVIIIVTTILGYGFGGILVCIFFATLIHDMLKNKQISYQKILISFSYGWNADLLVASFFDIPHFLGIIPSFFMFNNLIEMHLACVIPKYGHLGNTRKA